MNINLNMVHLHLILNHIPVLGAIFVTALFIIALVFRNVFLQKVSLWFLVMVALSTAVVYFTGDHSVALVENLPTYSSTILDAHRKAAQLGLAAMFVTGMIALGGALLYSNKPRLPRLLSTSVLIILLLNSVLFTYIAYLGGQVNNPTIRSNGPVSGPIIKLP